VIDLNNGPYTDDTNAPTVDRISRRQFLRLSLWLTIGLVLLAFVVSSLFGKTGVWRWLQPADLWTWYTAISGGLAAALGATTATLVLNWRPLQAIARRLMELVKWEDFARLDYLTVAAMAALGEELLFRGTLQPLIGLLPAAAIFGLLHATAVAHVVLAGLLGVFLGWLFEWSDSLWSPIVAHLMIDLVVGLILANKLQPSFLSGGGD
jgi:membrane protease YdiL (CAAX protease family)